MSMVTSTNVIINTLRLTKQEKSVVQFLIGKDKVYWETLAQFAKDPQTVKQKTLQKIISDIKKKYRDAEVVCPFNCKFELMVPIQKTGPAIDKNTQSNWDEDLFNYDIKEMCLTTIDAISSAVEDKPQTFVKFNRDRWGATAKSKELLKKDLEKIEAAPVIQEINELPAHRDFKLEKNYKRVRTKNGAIELRDQEWEIFCYLHSNAEKVVGLEEIKNVVWKNWGSKTPPSWAESIARSLTNLRKSIPELKLQGRLLTITGQTTAYMLR